MTLSLSNLVLALFGGVFLVFILLGTGARRMHWFYFLVLAVYTGAETHLLYKNRSVFLQLRWVILPLFGLFFLVRMGRNRGGLKSDGSTLWFFFFTAVAASTAATVSSGPYVTLAKVVTLLFLFFAVFLGYRAYLNGYEDGCHVTAAGYSVYGIFVLAASALVFLFLRPMAFKPSFRGIFNNPNVLGMMILAVAPFLFYMFLNPRAKRPRPSFLGVLGVLAGMLVLTGSRASLGAFLISMGILVLVFNRRYLPVLGALGIMVYGYMFFTGLSDTTGFVDSAFVRKYIYKDRADIFGKQRRPILEATLKNIRQNPYLGIGYGISYQWEGNQERFIQSGYLDKREKGNSYLAIQEETGLPGSLVVLVLIFRLLSRGYRVIRIGLRSLPRDDPDLALLVVFYADVVGLLLNAAFENWLFSVGHILCVVFWINFLATARLTERVRARVPEMAAREEPVRMPVAMPNVVRPRPVPQPAAARPRQFTY